MKTEKRILVVDDDDAIRALVATVLRRRGLRADCVRNGVEAMERIEACHYSLVLLDLMMPQMSGYDVLDRLARLPDAMRPIVIVLTAGIEQRDLDTRLVVGTIHKPFDVELLLDTVSGCLTSVLAHPQLDNCPPEDTAQTRSEKPN